jgi:two-component system capsular synthesis response regulator RcsB
VGRVVGEADSAQALMALLGSQPCDLLVTDYSMPGSPRPMASP